MALTTESAVPLFAQYLGMTEEAAKLIVDADNAEEQLAKLMSAKVKTRAENKAIELTNKLKSKAKELFGVEIEVEEGKAVTFEEVVDQIKQKYKPAGGTNEKLSDADFAKLDQAKALKRERDEFKDKFETLQTNFDKGVEAAANTAAIRVAAQGMLAELGGQYNELPQLKAVQQTAFLSKFDGITSVEGANGKVEYYDKEGKLLTDDNENALDLRGLVKVSAKGLFELKDVQDRNDPGIDPKNPAGGKKTGAFKFEHYKGAAPKTRKEAYEMYNDFTKYDRKQRKELGEYMDQMPPDNSLDA